MPAAAAASARSASIGFLQFAHFLAATWRARKGVTDAEVRAVVHCGLNGRPAAPLIDPTRDLARIPIGSHDRDWILPPTVLLRGERLRSNP